MEPRTSSWLIPGAIIAAGIIFSITIFVMRDAQLFGASRGDIGAVRPVSPEEHIIGNPDAPVIIIEYADMDSPAAKEFQRTLAQLVSDYGATGKVAWVYRHFPLVNQYPSSARHAEAAECISSLGNASAFWKFIDLLQAAAPDVATFSPEDYDTLVPQLGIRVDEFNACMAEGRFEANVNADFENALQAGAVASPFSIVLIEGREPVTIKGAVPYGTLTRIVDSAN